MTDFLLIDNFTKKPYLIILNEWKICSLFIKSTFVLLNRSLLIWSKTTQYALIMKEKIMKLLHYCINFHQNLNLTILSHLMPSWKLSFISKIQKFNFIKSTFTTYRDWWIVLNAKSVDYLVRCRLLVLAQH